MAAQKIPWVLLSFKPSNPCPRLLGWNFPTSFPEALLKSKQLCSDTSLGQTGLSAVRGDALAGFLPSHCRLPPSHHQSTLAASVNSSLPLAPWPSEVQVVSARVKSHQRKTGCGGRERKSSSARESQKVHLGFGLPRWNLSSGPPERGRQALCHHPWAQQHVPSVLLVGCMREGALDKGSGMSLFIHVTG